MFKHRPRLPALAPTLLHARRVLETTLALRATREGVAACSTRLPWQHAAK